MTIHADAYGHGGHRSTVADHRITDGLFGMETQENQGQWEREPVQTSDMQARRGNT
ncbi:MAG: hypothetical protein MUC47_02545 [Candidatus Kapabacteria bacterium]|nr:hypothetical protein [Candidatus Kapabacteria bacterium]